MTKREDLLIQKSLIDSKIKREPAKLCDFEYGTCLNEKENGEIER